MVLSNHSVVLLSYTDVENKLIFQKQSSGVFQKKKQKQKTKLFKKLPVFS